MYIKVNDIDLWYEMKGSGKPFILLHGNGESHEIFDTLTEELSKKITVYAIDSRDHGKSTRTNKLSYEMLTEDVVSFINELKLEKENHMSYVINSAKLYKIIEPFIENIYAAST